MSDMIAVSRESRLAQLGLETAAKEVVRQRSVAKKLDIAYQYYRFVEEGKINDFNMNLFKATRQDAGGLLGYDSYSQLTFMALSEYPAVPPVEVLDALEAAYGHQCFDRFEVAQITELSVPKPDPILFGLVNGCSDRFFIAQWDEDVKIEDILAGDEGWVKAGREDHA